MRDVITPILKWQKEEKKFVIATVISTWGSAPRKTGSMMVINENEEFSGSVSGGCVETAVIQESINLLSTNNSLLLDYGVSNEEAWNVGLACGGKITVLLQVFSNDYLPMIEAVVSETPISYTVNIDPNDDAFGNINITNDINISGVDSIVVGTENNLFTNSISPSPTLIIIGGVQISQHLSALAQIVGYDVIIIEPRKAFATDKRFPSAKLINKWPDDAFIELPITSTTAIVALSHNPGIDDPALIAAINSDCFYIGALGSKTTQIERKKRLAAQNIDNNLILKIKGPAGLKIGADSQEEIALSIMAEIIQDAHK